MLYTKQKGFTLIELLVVVAIIGILALVVTASLGSARDKSRDAAIKSTLKNLHIEAELWYLDHDTYFISKAMQLNGYSKCAEGYALTNLFYKDVQDMIAQIEKLNGDYNLTCRAREDANGNSTYAVSTKLSDGTDICIDSTGNLKNTASIEVGSKVYCS